MTSDNSVIGKLCRVTGEVCPGHIGEVMMPIRGGIEAFYAEPYDGRETIAVGDECVVVEYQPQLRSRTVLVTAMPQRQ
ncbi:MAG: hypothetical protein ACR2KV_07800 [Solirubrobacteraceae bacterium]